LAGRIGREAKLPPQFGQTPFNAVSTQERQKVHSNVQIIASSADGGRSLSQHSQLGLSSSIIHLDIIRINRLQFSKKMAQGKHHERTA
jgi:hypothetical protein